MNLTRAERETHFNMTAQDRIDGKGWEVFTDDTLMINRLNRIANGEKCGAGYRHVLEYGQIRLFKATNKGHGAILAEDMHE